MKRIILSMLLVALSSGSYAVPTTYKSVYRDSSAKKIPNDRRANDLYHHYPQHSYPPQHYPPQKYSQYPQRPQIAVVTPNVGIYVTPQPQYHYQKTEEVYLPYGGTYRKTTDYIPQYSHYGAIPTQPSSRTVIQQGHYYIEQEQQ